MIERLSDVLVRVFNDVKFLCKHSSMVHTQPEKVARSQNGLLRDMHNKISKDANGVDKW